MQVTLENDDGLDFATLVLVPGRDDSFAVGGYGSGGISIRVPLYSYQAREVIEVLTTLAERKELE